MSEVSSSGDGLNDVLNGVAAAAAAESDISKPPTEELPKLLVHKSLGDTLSVVDEQIKKIPSPISSEISSSSSPTVVPRNADFDSIAEETHQASEYFPGTVDESDTDDDSDQEDDVTLPEEIPFDYDALERRMEYLNSLDSIELPKTVARLKTKRGTRIFLVGTAHFSEESQEDVSTTIRAVRPDVIMVELCSQREHVLNLDEETVLRESQNLNAEKVFEFIQSSGLVRGLTYVLLLSLSAHVTKQLGMAPGGEFRRAFRELKELRRTKKTNLYLGDRPVQVTLKRALSALSFFQKIRLAWSIMMDGFKVTKEDVENMKEKDMLHALMSEMAAEYPLLTKVFVKERDLWLVQSLVHTELLAAKTLESPLPGVVVAVVGIGHQQGIVDEWNKIQDENQTLEEGARIITELLVIPETSMTSKIVKLGFKAAFVTLALWGCVRIVKAFA